LKVFSLVKYINNKKEINMGLFRRNTPEYNEREEKPTGEYAKTVKRRIEMRGAVEKKIQDGRCALCNKYNPTYPVQITCCDRCTSKATAYRNEVKSIVSRIWTMKPCFYCGARNSQMFNVNTRICLRCIQQISNTMKRNK